MAVFTKYLFCTLPIRRGRLVKSGHPQTGGVGGQPNVDKFGQGGGGGQKIRKFCGCHMWTLPNPPPTVAQIRGRELNNPLPHFGGCFIKF